MEDINNINAISTFIMGPKIDVFDNHSEIYLVEFYEKLGTEWALVKSIHDYKPFTWFQYNRTFRTQWQIRVYGLENELPKLVYQHTYNETNKNVLITFDEPNYDVQLKWLIKVDGFAKKFNCNVTVDTQFKERLKKNVVTSVKLIDKIKNYNEYTSNENIYAHYNIGKRDIQSKSWEWWESGGIFENHSKHYISWDYPDNWIKFANEDLIDNILGL